MAIRKTKLRTGDNVLVISGKDKGKTGKIKKILYKKNRVIVENINIRKKHVKGQGIIEFEAPIHISNVMLLCPSCEKPTRIAIKFENGKKFRVCKKCNQVIDEISKSKKEKATA